MPGPEDAAMTSITHDDDDDDRGEHPAEWLSTVVATLTVLITVVAIVLL